MVIEVTREILMNNMTLIDSENYFSNLVSSIDWEDAFIKDLTLKSPSTLDFDTGHTIAPDADFSLEMLILLPEGERKEIRFLFEEVDVLTCYARTEIDPFAKYRFNEIEIYIFGKTDFSIRCKKVYYQY